jgi:hypothetical protein
MFPFRAIEAGQLRRHIGKNGVIHDFVRLNNTLSDPGPEAATCQMSAEIKAHLAP